MRWKKKRPKSLDGRGESWHSPHSRIRLFVVILECLYIRT